MLSIFDAVHHQLSVDRLNRAVLWVTSKVMNNDGAFIAICVCVVKVRFIVVVASIT